MFSGSYIGLRKENGGDPKGFMTSKTSIENKFVKAAPEEELKEGLQPSNPDEPPLDPRPLVVKLMENRQKRRDEFQAKLKQMNSFRGLEQDEIEYLEELKSQGKSKSKEEEKEFQEKLKQLESAQPSPSPSTSLLSAPKVVQKKKATADVAAVSSKKDFQSSLLSSIIQPKASSVQKRPLSAAGGDEDSNPEMIKKSKVDEDQNARGLSLLASYGSDSEDSH